jgi:CubicO group peptidase (beta-lactamase class C family)
MYLVAGLVLDRASGEGWADFIQNRILLPLGMGRARPVRWFLLVR